MRARLSPLAVIQKLFMLGLVLWLAGASSSTSGEYARSPLRLPESPAAGIPAAAWQTILQAIRFDQLTSSKADQLAPTRLLDPRLSAAEQWLETARLLPEDPQANLTFGYSIAIDDDLVAVGAYWDHRPEPGCGAVYLFRVPASGWAGIHQIAKLTVSEPDMHDQLGWSVDIYGNDIVAGAPGDDGYKGAAYIFAQPLGGWRDTTELVKLTSLERDWSDYFGQTVVFSGYATIAVGAPLDDVGSEVDHGSVYIFNRGGGIWPDTESAHFTTTDGDPGDSFGRALAADEDTIVVGAHAHKNGEDLGAGQVYVYRHDTGWATRNQDARLLASDSADHEYFGWSVAVDGDVIVVGAPGEDSFDSNGQEAAYVYLRPAGDWSGMLTEDAQLTASDGEADDDFGARVAIDGEVIAVSATSTGISGGAAVGAVYVYTRPAGGWVSSTETDKLVASGDEYDEDFGVCLAVQEGVILSGASESDIPEYVDNGTVYVFTPLATAAEFLHLPIVRH